MKRAKIRKQNKRNSRERQHDIIGKPNKNKKRAEGYKFALLLTNQPLWRANHQHEQIVLYMLVWAILSLVLPLTSALTFSATIHFATKRSSPCLKKNQNAHRPSEHPPVMGSSVVLGCNHLQSSAIIVYHIEEKTIGSF